MAETTLSLTSFKKQFDDQLTCGVCLDQYTNPKMLPCYHTFCLQCIQQLPARKQQQQEEQYYISCPTCLVDHVTPQGSAINLPNAFHINSLLDLRKKLVTLEIIKQTTSPSEPTTCPKHNDPLKVYCETCCQVICCECTIGREHKTHNYYLISECYPKHFRQLQDSLDLVKQKTADIDLAVAHLATREMEVHQQGQKLKEQMSTHAQQIIDRVQRSCTHLSQQVDTIVQQKTEVLTAQRQQAQKLHTQLKTCQDMIECNLKEWSEHQILAEKSTWMEKMNTVAQTADPTVLQPIESAKLKFAKNDIIEEEIGHLISATYGKATLMASPCVGGEQPSTATLTLQSHDGSPFSLPPSLITCKLSSPGNKHTMKCSITQTHPGKYNILFSPSFTSGDPILAVQVGGVDIPESPFALSAVMHHSPVTSKLDIPQENEALLQVEQKLMEDGVHTYISSQHIKEKFCNHSTIKVMYI